MKLVLREYNLKLKHTFTISRESIDFQPSLIVELQNEGFSGFGEATSNPYYKTTVPVMMQDLDRIRNIIESTAATNGKENLGVFTRKLWNF